MPRLFFTGFFFLSAFFLIASQTLPVIGATSECNAGFICSTGDCTGISGGTCDGGFGICCKESTSDPGPGGPECAAGYTCSPNGCAGTSAGTCDGGFGICCKSFVPPPGSPPSPGPGGKALCPNGVMKSGVCFPTGTGLSSRPVGVILMGLMNWLLTLVGMIAIIAFVISGIQYLISAGDDEMIKTAKRNMTYSIVGVLVALSGWVIIKAIDQALSGGLLSIILGLFGF